MKKFVATLLFFIFANSFFVGAFAGSDVKATLKLSITDASITNLGKAVTVFENEYNAFCDKEIGIGKDEEICKDGKTFSQFEASTNLKEVATPKKFMDNVEKSFGYVAGFYNELRNFQGVKKKTEKFLSEAINEKRAEILRNREELLKLLNEERKALNPLLDGKNYEEIKELSLDNATAPNSDLAGYKDKGVEEHNTEDIYSEPTNINNIKQLEVLANSINKEIEKTKINIDNLKGIADKNIEEKRKKKQKELNTLWEALKTALETEKDAVNDYLSSKDKSFKKDKTDYKKIVDKINISTMNGNLGKIKDVSGLQNHTGDKNNLIKKPNLEGVNDKDLDTEFEKLKNAIEKQTTVANLNAEKLNNAKLGAEQAELEELKKKLMEAKQAEAELLYAINKENIGVDVTWDEFAGLNKALDKVKKMPEAKDILKQDDKNDDVKKALEEAKTFKEKRQILQSEIDKLTEEKVGINPRLDRIKKAIDAKKAQALKERQEILDAAWNKLKQALENEKNALYEYDGSMVSCNDENGKIYVGSINSAITSVNEDRESRKDKFPANLDEHAKETDKIIKKPDLNAKNFNELISKINEEANIAIANVEKLKVASEEAKKRGKAREIIRKFDDLMKAIYKISVREILILNKADTIFNENGMPKKRHVNMASPYKSVGYSTRLAGRNDDVPNITYNRSIDKLKLGISVEVLTYEDMERIGKQEIVNISLTDLDKWLKYIDEVIGVAENNISNLDKYIADEHSFCPNYDYSTVVDAEKVNEDKGNYVYKLSSRALKTFNGEPGVEYILYEEVEKCLSESLNFNCGKFSGDEKNSYIEKLKGGKNSVTGVQREIDSACAGKKCEKFEQIISPLPMIGDLKRWNKYVSSKEPETCVKKMNEGNCEAYKKKVLGEETKFTFTPVSPVSSSNETVDYLEACKKAVDDEALRLVIEKDKESLKFCFEIEEKSDSEKKEIKDKYYNMLNGKNLKEIQEKVTEECNKIRSGNCERELAEQVAKANERLRKKYSKSLGDVNYGGNLDNCPKIINDAICPKYAEQLGVSLDVSSYTKLDDCLKVADALYKKKELESLKQEIIDFAKEYSCDVSLFIKDTTSESSNVSQECLDGKGGCTGESSSKKIGEMNVYTKLIKGVYVRKEWKNNRLVDSKKTYKSGYDNVFDFAKNIYEFCKITDGDINLEGVKCPNGKSISKSIVEHLYIFLKYKNNNESYSPICLIKENPFNKVGCKRACDVIDNWSRYSK